ncbi:polysaccharide deacetylase family protein [Neobacillus kokaensis]|uniref:NodB homology domain-containing protein n=1 Tax=Neobacillus kokaensis TaxID=2759023 RepID=A0ABQ3N0G1_9BACI|nr:polysaccharide deacetylase family protein [Neobacillus kokaensis]GHH97350.1 hypothetical protein AM1BK_08930 [Neobacillus kokaensis]
MGQFRKIQWIVLLSVLFLLSGCWTQTPHESKEIKRKEIGLEPKEIDSASIKILQNMMKLAQAGTVPGCPFNVLNSTIDQAKAEWGEPDQVDQAGLGFYATYEKRNIVLGYNKAGEIFDVRSYADNLKDLTDKMVEKEFGQPAEKRNNTNENIYVYPISQDIQLKIIIPKSAPIIDHYSIYNPNRVAGDYTLEIKGRSNNLSKSAWASMQRWRNEIVVFSKDQENVYINGPDKKMVALTFDDGPDTVITPAIIDILARHHVKGNFFFLGSKVKEHPDVAKEAYRRGNLVLSHSYDHVELTKLEPEAIRNEIDQAGKMIKSVTGKEPAVLRTPYGDTNAEVAQISKQQGYSIVLWSIDTLDWSQKDPENIIHNVAANVRNGDIILMHSDSDKIATKKALPKLIKELQERNYEIVDLEELLNIQAYQ